MFVKTEKCVFHAVCSIPGVHHFVQGCVHGSRQDSGCGQLVNFGYPQGPADVSGVCHFICNCSQLVTPLLSLTSTKTLFVWSNAAEAAFSNLKSHFVSIPLWQLLIPLDSLWLRLMHLRWGCSSFPAVLRGRTDASLCALFPSFIPRRTALRHWQLGVVGSQAGL